MVDFIFFHFEKIYKLKKMEKLFLAVNVNKDEEEVKI
jgi:hypothetical protein